MGVPTILSNLDRRIGSEQEYTAVRDLDEKNNLTEEEAIFDSFNTSTTSRSDSALFKWMFLSYLLVSSAIIAFLSIEAFRPQPAPEPPKSKVQIAPCGNSTAEARAAGCHFDLISFSWLPTACYDAELSEEFGNYTEWGYWKDQERKHPVSMAEAMTGEYSGLYTEFEYHLRHCTFLWKKMHRAMLNGGKATVDSVIAGYHHTQHCEEMLMNKRSEELTVLNSIIMLKFPDCGIE